MNLSSAVWYDPSLWRDGRSRPVQDESEPDDHGRSQASGSKPGGSSNSVFPSFVLPVSEPAKRNAELESSESNGWLESSQSNGWLESSQSNGWLESSESNGWLESSQSKGWLESSERPYESNSESEKMSCADGKGNAPVAQMMVRMNKKSRILRRDWIYSISWSLWRDSVWMVWGVQPGSERSLRSIPWAGEVLAEELLADQAGAKIFANMILADDVFVDKDSVYQMKKPRSGSSHTYVTGERTRKNLLLYEQRTVSNVVSWDFISFQRARSSHTRGKW